MAVSRRRSFGKLRKLPSGRWQASYLDPTGRRWTASDTYENRQLGEEFLERQRIAIRDGVWKAPDHQDAPAAPALTVAVYAATWLANRNVRPRTRAHYRSLLDDHILPTFGDRELGAVKPADVAAWHATVAKGRPTLRAHAYGLLRTIYTTAVAEDQVPANPCRIRGAGTTKRVKKMKPATMAELEIIVSSVPARYRLMVLFAAWGALRFGELTELRRKDIDTAAGVIHIRRAVVHVKGECEIGDPKTEAGKRDVTIPPHLMPAVKAHLLEHTGKGRDGLLFSPTGGGCHIVPSTLYRVYYPARTKAGRDDLRFHDLRHTGAVWAADAGATLAELMARLGHSTVGAAMRYQHAAQDRDRELAERMSERATKASVVDIGARRTRARAR